MKPCIRKAWTLVCAKQPVCRSTAVVTLMSPSISKNCPRNGTNNMVKCKTSAYSKPHLRPNYLSPNGYG